MPDANQQGSPEWWRKKLSERLDERGRRIRRCNDYYEGKHRLKFAGQKFQEAFGGLFGAFADNWCEVVCDAVEERLNVEGFRFGTDPNADDDAWNIWQRNQLDADSQLVHTDALVTGYGYGLVWAGTDGEPLITGESPLEAIVAHSPGSRRERSAGLKQWIDDDGYAYACVYLPDELYKFRSRSKIDAQLSDLSSSTWEPYTPDGEDYPLKNPLGRVPLVPLYNKPRLRPVGGVSEIAKVIPLQDAVNKLCTDLMVASEFGSFRQRWATGLELDTDEAGNKVFPFKTGAGNVWATEATGLGVADTPSVVTFGEFGETNLSNIVGAISMFVAHLASQSRTPPHYLNPGADRLSGESIKAAETGLVAKTRRKMRHFGEAWEEVMRLAYAVKGDDAKANETRAEVIWADPESRTEAEHVDATMKKKTLGVPWQQLMEDLDYNPTQIARMRTMRLQDMLEGVFTQPTLPTPPTVPPA